MQKLLLVLAMLGAAIMMVAPPTASGVIHEIVAQWCAGKGALTPPGLVKHEHNFAQPVVSTIEEGVVPFDPPGAQPAGFLLVLDYDAPPSKGEGTGVYIQIDTIEGAPLYLELFDLSHPAFDHCKKLRT